MNAVIHETLSSLSTIFGCILVLGLIAVVNFAFSRDKVINRTMRHQ